MQPDSEPWLEMAQTAQWSPPILLKNDHSHESASAVHTAHLVDAGAAAVLVRPHRHAVLELCAVLQIQHGARVAGVDDCVQLHAGSQRVDQQLIQLIIHNLAPLQRQWKPWLSTELHSLQDMESCIFAFMSARKVREFSLQSNPSLLHQTHCGHIGRLQFSSKARTLLRCSLRAQSSIQRRMHLCMACRTSRSRAGSRRGRWSHCSRRPRPLTNPWSGIHALRADAHVIHTSTLTVGRIAHPRPPGEILYLPAPHPIQWGKSSSIDSHVL